MFSMIDCGQGGEAKALFGADEGLADGDFFYMLADSAAMMDQYGHKDTLCRAMGEVGQDATDDVLMQAFANITNQYWGPQFGSRSVTLAQPPSISLSYLT